MAEISGKFQLVNGDEDNFDKIMAAAGVSDEKRTRGRSMKPTIQYSREGENYKVTYSTDGNERSHLFQLDVELDETTLDGRQVKSTYKRDGKKIVQSEKQENGKVIVYEREIQGDELHVKIACGSLQAHRVFKKI